MLQTVKSFFFFKVQPSTLGTKCGSQTVKQVLPNEALKTRDITPKIEKQHERDMNRMQFAHFTGICKIQ